jgi:hypothetical protein
MTDLKHPRKTWWRRAMRQILPAFIAFFIGIVAIMVLDRSMPFVQTWGKIVPPTVEAGQEVSFHFGLYKISSYGGTIHRWIVDAHGVIYSLKDTPTTGDSVPFNKVTEEVKKFPIPCGISIGPAVFHSDAETHVWWNLVQRFIWPLHNYVQYPFTVIQAPHNTECGFTGGSTARGPAGPQGIQGKPGEPGGSGGRGGQGGDAPDHPGRPGLPGLPGLPSAIPPTQQ